MTDPTPPWVYNALTQHGFRLDLLKFDFESLEDKLTQRVARAYVQNFTDMIPTQTGLTITGIPGSGKTTLVSIIAKHLCATYALQPECVDLDAVAETVFQYSSEAQTERVQHLLTCSVLILDDFPRLLDASRAKARPLSELVAYVLKRRRQNGKITFFVTSATHAELESALGASLLDEILALNVTVELPEVDYRPRAKEAVMKKLMGGGHSR